MFARNSLVRDMTFRANFIIDTISSISWMVMNLGFYALVYRETTHIADWGKYEFFVFISTTMFVNSIVQAFFMPNAEELSEQVRTGGLDFALLKPIDTQFLVSLRRVAWSSLGIFVVALILLAYSVPRIGVFRAADRRISTDYLAVYSLPAVCADGRDDSVQRDDRAGCHEHLARPESITL
jgi:ABC-2 type transport system permease protein